LELLPKDDKTVTDKNNNTPVCSNHGYRECQFVCLQCKIPLFNTCMTMGERGPHWGHRIEEIDKAVSQIEKDVANNLKKLKYTVKTREEIVEEIVEKVENWKTATEKAMMARAEEVMEQLKRWKTDKLKEVGTIYSDAINKIKYFTSTDAETAGEIKIALEDINKMG